MNGEEARDRLKALRARVNTDRVFGATEALELLDLMIGAASEAPATNSGEGASTTGSEQASV